MRQSSALISVLALFVSGISIGALGMHLYDDRRAHDLPGPADRPPGGPPPGAPFTRRLDAALDLTPEQRERIAEILAESRRESDLIRRELRPRLRRQMEETRRRIHEVLTEEQRARFDAFHREQRARMDRFFLGEERQGPRGPRRRGPPG